MYAIRITEQVTRKKKAGAGLLKVLMIAFGVFFVLLGIVFSRGFMLSGFLLICLYLAYEFFLARRNMSTRWKEHIFRLI